MNSIIISLIPTFGLLLLGAILWYTDPWVRARRARASNVDPSTGKPYVEGPDTVRCATCREFEHCAFAQCDTEGKPLCTTCAKDGTQRWDPLRGYMVTTL